MGGVTHQRQKVVQRQVEETPEKEREAFHTGRVEGKRVKPFSGKQSKHNRHEIAQ